MRRSLAALVALGLVAGGCVTKTVKRVNVTTAEHAEREIPSDELLNVDVAVFDTGIPDPEVADPDEGVFLEVRRAEARILPVELRDTLARTGHWGAVRVVPEPLESSELLVTGEILASDGRNLELAVRAVDATGRVWLERTYEEQAAKLSYTERAAADLEPFQDVYNRIANDLLAVRRQRGAEQLRAIRRAAFLRFAADLSPEAFAPYLEADDGRFQVVGMPADDDPNVARIEAIRDRDYALIDALDQHYGVFRSRVDVPYDEWREASYREVQNLEKLEKEAFTRTVLGAAALAGGIAGVVLGASGPEGAASTLGILAGAAVLQSGLEKRSESKIHAEALKELGQSLEADLAPRVVELEGQTVTLSGSAEAQYEEWRKLLREIYARETGFALETRGR